MARKNPPSASYAERHAEEIQAGEHPVSNKEPENELDTTERQDEILNPPVEFISLPSGIQIELKTVPTFNDIRVRQIHNVLASFFKVLGIEVIKLTQDNTVGSTPKEINAWSSRNMAYLSVILYKPAVQNIMADALSILSGKPASLFFDLEDEQLQKACVLLIKMHTDLTVKSQSKNGVTKAQV